MPNRKTRLLSDPFNSTGDLSDLFKNLKLQRETDPTISDTVTQISETTSDTVQQNFELKDDMTEEMGVAIQALQAQLAALVTESGARINELAAANVQLTQKLTGLEQAQAAVQQPNKVTVTEYVDVVPIYTTGADIQLDAFKVIHEFNGDKKVYRSWRMQVSKLMKQIEGHNTHPRYAAALSIIRAKITGPASDILINNNTAHNIDAIIDRLDFSYADQRPLYVIEAEMTSLKQNSKSLQEFYDAINQALNMVLTKITMTYKEAAGQKSLIAETQNKAIRTFITGLNSTLIRTTLYGNMPKSLSQAFAVAQTIQYDNQHLQLELKTHELQKNPKKFMETRPNSNPNFRYQIQQLNQPPKRDTTTTAPQSKPTPMEIDSSKQFAQKTNFQPNDFAQFKRQRDPSFQYANKQPPSFQHANKQQRVNHVDEHEEIHSVYDVSMDNNCATEIPDNESVTSEHGSVFLDE